MNEIPQTTDDNVKGIFEVIKDNHQFKIHVNKWIMFIIEDIMENNEEYQLKTLL